MRHVLVVEHNPGYTYLRIPVRLESVMRELLVLADNPRLLARVKKLFFA